MVVEKPEALKLNVIHQSEIWRQLIKNENKAASNWESNWSFIRDANGVNAKSKLKLPVIKTKVDPHASGLPSKLPSGLAMTSESIISDWISAYQVTSIQNYRYPASKYSFPSTTSSEVGWPWGRVDEYGNEEQAPAKESNINPVKSKYTPKYYTLERFESSGPKGRDSKWRGNTTF